MTKEQIDHMKKPIDWQHPVKVEVSNDGECWAERYPLTYLYEDTIRIHSITALNIREEREYLDTGLVKLTQNWNYWRPIPQKTTRPMTPDEVLQLINDNPNMWIIDDNMSYETVVRTSEGNLKIDTSNERYDINYIIDHNKYSLTLLGEVLKFEVTE